MGTPRTARFTPTFFQDSETKTSLVVNHVGRLTLADSLLPLVTPLPTAAALEGLAGGVIKASSGSFRPASPIPASHSPALPFLFLDAWEAEAGRMWCVEPSIIMLPPGQRRAAACATVSSARYWTIIVALRDRTTCTMGWTQVLGVFQHMTRGEIATRKEAVRRADKGEEGERYVLCFGRPFGGRYY